MTKTMTVGNPTKIILAFTIPLLIGNIFQQFYSMVDAIIVGRFVGVKALAAVGVTGSMMFLILGFIIGLTGGFSVMVAQKFGANDEDGLRHSIAMSVYLCIIFSVLITIIAMAIAKPLLNQMNTPIDIYDDAYTYIIIIFAGSFVVFIYNMLSGILKALGDSKTPLYFLIIASVLNIILDLFFVIYLKLGVAGVAYATVISQGLSGLLCFIYMKRKFPILKFQKKDWFYNKDTVKRLLMIGLPMSFQFLVTAIGVMILQSAINRFGSNVVAAFTAASKVEQLATQPLLSLGITMATYTGQNLGAGKLDRIKMGVKSSLIICFVFSILGGIMMYLFGSELIKMFLSSPQPEVLAYANKYISISSIFFLALGILFVFRNTLQGLGEGLIPFLAGFTELMVRTIIALGFSGKYGYTAICFASPGAWIAAAVLLFIFYHVRMKALERQM